MAEWTGSPEGHTPTVAELEAKSPADAFEYLASEVPELLQLRHRVASTRVPVDPALGYEDFRKRQRQADGGGFLNAGARTSIKGRVALRLELARLVGPKAAQGNELVRSKAAYVQCAMYLFAVPWDSDSED